MKKLAIGGTLVVSGLVAAFLIAGGRTSSPDLLEDQRVGVANNEGKGRAAEVSASARKPIQAPSDPEPLSDDVVAYPEGSLGQVMQDFYGDEWGEARRHLGDLDLTAEASSAGYRPWPLARADVRANLQAHLNMVQAVLEMKVTEGRSVEAWGAEMNALIEGGDFSQSQKAYLSSGLGDVKAELRELLAQARPPVVEYLAEAIERETYRKRPLVGWSPLAVSEDEDLIAGFIVAHGGWVVDLEAKSAYFPYEKALLDTAKDSLRAFEEVLAQQ